MHTPPAVETKTTTTTPRGRFHMDQPRKRRTPSINSPVSLRHTNCSLDKVRSAHLTHSGGGLRRNGKGKPRVPRTSSFHLSQTTIPPPPIPPSSPLSPPLFFLLFRLSDSYGIPGEALNVDLSDFMNEL